MDLCREMWDVRKNEQDLKCILQVSQIVEVKSGWRCSDLYA